jgi:8-amino-3,8-dideoxy-alpha-D-manno-octulosonate transaminase
MPGFEVFGAEEREAINEIFDPNGGIVFAHGFDALRNGVYRVRDYEAAYAKKMGAKYAQAVSSGTAALAVGLAALGVGAGDEVITQSHTFVATVEAIILLGATPVIVDVDETLNMSPQALEQAISPRTKAVIPVHMLGVPAKMDEILSTARRYGLSVLEDAAQALGGSYRGKRVGTLGRVGAFSTDAGKTLNTGEGGMVVTDDEQLFIRARAFHDHGHEYSKVCSRGEERAQSFGFNFRMTELQGAIGLAQLRKLEVVLERQRENKRKLKAKIGNLPIRFREIPDAEGEIGDTLVFSLETKKLAKAFVAEMKKEGLGTKNIPDAMNWHFAKNWKHMAKPLCLAPEAFETRWTASDLLLSRAVALPIMVKMDDERIDAIAAKLRVIAERVI